jgi:flagellar basal body-associated protein FliL
MEQMNMRKKALTMIAMLGLIVLLCVPAVGAWSINPAKWTLYARTATDYEITPKVWPLELTNDGNSSISVTLSIKEAEYTYDGFVKMPDLSWVSIDETDIVIPAHETKRVTVSVDVTNASQNYNQSMEFWIFADQTAGAGNIQTDYNCRWMYISPVRYVPIDQRPGYIPWNIVIAIVGILAGVAAVAFILARRGMFRRKKPTTQPASIREQKKQAKEIKRTNEKTPVANNTPIANSPAPVGSNGNNIVKYKKKV